MKKIADEDFDPAVDEDIEEASAKAKTDLINERLLSILEKLSEKEDQGPIKQIPLPKAALRTPWNPSGRRIGRPKLTRDTYMQGSKLREINMSDEEIELFNQIKAGRYLEGKVVVTEKHADKGKDEVELRMANKTIEDRIIQAQMAPDAVTLLKKILSEYESQHAA